MTPARISVVLLVVAIAATGVAWSIQSSAASALETTLRLQSADVGDSDAAAPSVQENRDILEVLGESIAIRKRIDGLLSEVESAVVTLARRQDAALQLARRGSGQLDAIGSALGGAVGSTRRSVRRLGGLRGRLGRSARLAAAIERELEELDRKLGPSPGRTP